MQESPLHKFVQDVAVLIFEQKVNDSLEKFWLFYHSQHFDTWQSYAMAQNLK